MIHKSCRYCWNAAINKIKYQQNKVKEFRVSVIIVNFQILNGPVLQRIADHVIQGRWILCATFGDVKYLLTVSYDINRKTSQITWSASYY